MEHNLPDNFNLGKGSYGYIFQFNSLLSISKYGFLLSSNYQWNANSNSGYHFGNEFSSKVSVFREWNLNKWSLILNIGLLAESIDRNKHENGNYVPETGGRGLFIDTGLNFRTEKWMAGISFSEPIIQHYSNDVVDARYRTTTHISYLF